jgi:hypothetical protein
MVLGQVRVDPEPEHGQYGNAILSHIFSMCPELSLIQACLTFLLHVLKNFLITHIKI